MTGTLTTLLLLAIPSLALGQTAPSAAPAPAAAPRPCAAPEHRQFDFWLGNWEVSTAKGIAGTNRITKLFDDCGLREEYATPKGYSGTSFNVYDASRKVWHQTWVDNQGGLLNLEGGLRNGSMVLEGRHANPKGGQQIDRITWTPNADGSVRQHWEVSTDEGGSWTTAFDGTYRRAGR
ncbi:MAG: hypothetical protein R2862_06070 [Thermoanaerobaculia bacterium]